MNKEDLVKTLRAVGTSNQILFLLGTKLIAEAWDAGGLYQVGSFIGDSWKEWNGRFRDDFRSFIKGDEGTVSKLAGEIDGKPRHLQSQRP
jgi:pullulanase/glycogen debranching enzyme